MRSVTITLDLEPEVEHGLLVQATARGVSLADYAREILAREAKPSATSARRTGQDLVDACTRIRGLLTDEEVDTLFARTPSASRPVDFS